MSYLRFRSLSRGLHVEPAILLTVAAMTTDWHLSNQQMETGPATTYHYRIVAYSDTGFSEGDDKIFETQALPPEVTTGPASEIEQTQATLRGTVNPNSADTHYYFEYGTTTEYGTDIQYLQETTLDRFLSGPG
jgi:hypothetical protein